MFLKATRSLEGIDHAEEYINMAQVERMWIHDESGYTVLQFMSGTVASYKESMDYFVKFDKKVS